MPEKFRKVEQQTIATAPVAIGNAKTKPSRWGVLIALVLVVAAFLAAALIAFQFFRDTKFASY